MLSIAVGGKGPLWINHEQRRYYRVHLLTDLLGDLVVVRDFGSLDSQRGRVVTTVVSDHAAAIHFIDELNTLRRRHGYHPY